MIYYPILHLLLERSCHLPKHRNKYFVLTSQEAYEAKLKYQQEKGKKLQEKEEKRQQEEINTVRKQEKKIKKDSEKVQQKTTKKNYKSNPANIPITGDKACTSGTMVRRDRKKNEEKTKSTAENNSQSCASCRVKYGKERDSYKGEEYLVCHESMIVIFTSHAQKSVVY